MNYITLPDLPTIPGPGASQDDLNYFAHQVSYYDLALRTNALIDAQKSQVTREKQAAADQAIADAMRRASDTQDALMRDARLPDPPPPVEQQMTDMARAILATQARRSLNDAKFVASVHDQVTTFFRLMGLIPPAVVPPVVAPAPAPAPKASGAA